jgi:hypothetical protein
MSRRSEQRETTMIAWASFTSDALPPHTVVKRGDRFAAWDPAVKACPGYFVVDDGPTTELPNEYAAIRAMAEGSSKRWRR